jgi:hypothetical protein
MSINVTPIPRLTVLAAPAFTLGTSNAAGAALTAVASNSTILTYDTTLPEVIEFGQASQVGSATTAARRDHDHGMDTAVSGRVYRESANVTTTSTSLVAFTGASITFTTGANPIAYGAVQGGEASAVGTRAYNVKVDSGYDMGSAGLGIDMAANSQYNLSFSGQSAVQSAGEHTVALWWSTGAGTATTYANTSRAHIFWAHEVA